ncbi:Hypothetical predicted protein, partial [Pelobates cultripes]
MNSTFVTEHSVTYACTRNKLAHHPQKKGIITVPIYPYAMSKLLKAPRFRSGYKFHRDTSIPAGLTSNSYGTLAWTPPAA